MVFRPLPRHTAFATILAIVCLSIWIAWGSFRNPEALWAPGHLSRYHADIRECTQCHTPFRGITLAKCAACHAPERFTRRSGAATAAFHRARIAQGNTCDGCHTEHRGALSPITVAAFRNPHGEFVFRATGTQSCSACHDLTGGITQAPRLLDNRVVRHLLEEGDGAHRPGRMADCLRCHRGGRMDVEEQE